MEGYNNSDFFLVVGDAYELFANNENVMTASAFMRALNEPSCWVGNEQVVIGQGVSASELSKIFEMLKFREIKNISHFGDLVPLHLTHKRHTDHVLISSPKKVTSHCYEYSLVLNDRMDRLCDHVTGQHIGAMQFLEAARQAMIATLEYEYMESTGKHIGLILERFDSKFENYVFPLPISMSVNVIERMTAKNNHPSVTVLIGIFQVGRRMCQIEMDITLYDITLLGKIEVRNAKRAITTLMQTCQKPQNVTMEPL